MKSSEQPIHAAPALEANHDRRGSRCGANIKRALVALVIRMVHRRSVEYRLLLLLKAVGAKIVKGLGSCLVRIERVNRNPRSKVHELVSVCLGVPVFAGYQLAFNLTFNLGQLLAFGVGGEELRLKINHLMVQRDDCLLDFDIIGELQDAARHFRCGGGGSKGGSELRDHAADSQLSKHKPQP